MLFELGKIQYWNRYFSHPPFGRSLKDVILFSLSMADLDGDAEIDESSLEDESVDTDEDGDDVPVISEKEEPEDIEKEKPEVSEHEEKKDRISKELAVTPPPKATPLTLYSLAASRVLVVITSTTES